MVLQLTPKLPVVSNIYYVDLINNFQMQYAILSLLCVLLLGIWDKTLMIILMVISALLIIVNFNNQFNFDLFVDKKSSLVNRVSQTARIVQVTFDDDINKTFEAVYKKINTTKADVIALFNVNELHRDAIKTLSSNRYTYGFRKKEGMPSGIVLISKYPIISKRKSSFIDSNGDILDITISMKNNDVNLVLMHAPKPTDHINWKRRNLMLSTLESMQNRVESIHPYKIVMTELYTTQWSDYFPKIDNLRTCSNSEGLYTSWYVKENLKFLQLLGGIPTSHCFFSYRIQISDFESLPLKNIHHNLLTYVISIEGET